jgi:hypothetical protein
MGAEWLGVERKSSRLEQMQHFASNVYLDSLPQICSNTTKPMNSKLSTSTVVGPLHTQETSECQINDEQTDAIERNIGTFSGQARHQCRSEGCQRSQGRGRQRRSTRVAVCRVKNPKHAIQRKSS